MKILVRFGRFWFFATINFVHIANGAVLSDKLMTVVPRDAASIIMLRPKPSTNTKIEVLLVQRNVKSEFAPAAYVFPGGAVETNDSSLEIQELCSNLSAKQASERLQEQDAMVPETALQLFVAAIREAFEEVQILLAYREDMQLASFNQVELKRMAKYQLQLHNNQMFFSDILRKEGLTLATDQLHYVAHWITPEVAPRRYDTRFFIAPAPPNQSAHPDNTETTDALWITPQEAIERYEHKELSLLPPTIRNLETIAQFASVSEAITSVHGMEVPTIMPKVVTENGKMKIIF